MSKEILWSVTDFFIAMSELQDSGYQISHWKSEENWAIISSLSSTIGYLWRKKPLMFVVSKFSNELKRSLKNEDHIIFIQVEGLNSKELKINRDMLKEEQDIVDMDFDKFSVVDLWFCTNSI